MNNNKTAKDGLIKFRIGSMESKRLLKLQQITHQKQSELFRDALFFYMQFRYPETMDVELDD
jgi:hypothetical protein